MLGLQRRAVCSHARARAVDPSMSVKRKVTVPCGIGDEAVVTSSSWRRDGAESTVELADHDAGAVPAEAERQFEIATFTSASRASFGM